MDRETRDRFASSTDQTKLTSGSACWQTPPAVYTRLNDQFGPFTIDICADAGRHLCPTWFGPDSPVAEPDALLADWSAYGKRGFCNPPYGRFVDKILPKAKAEAMKGFTSVFLLPLRAKRSFRNHILRGATELLFSDQRIVFGENGYPRISVKGQPEAAMFDSIIVVYTPERPDAPLVGVWNAPEPMEQAASFIMNIPNNKDRR